MLSLLGVRRREDPAVRILCHFSLRFDHLRKLGCDRLVAAANTTTIISEHWDIVGDKAVRLRVAYYDPTLLLAQLSAAPVVA